MIALTLIKQFINILESELKELEPSERQVVMYEIEDIVNYLDDYLKDKAQKESLCHS